MCLAFPAIALAHGGEDHGHDDVPAAPSAVSGLPRVEAATETFEVVGTLSDHELALVVDRFETNEPVLNGKVEVEVDGAKSMAKFRPERGDYAVDDKALLTTLTKPGKHSVMFTIAAGNDSDLLEAAMQVADASGTTANAKPGALSSFPFSVSAMGIAALALVLAVATARVIRR
ncbi:hypothetical protein AYR66_15745 [Noviherbaspirillum denitrificans]|uniref:Uncharacterized protein n=2 Tax=Noviherbaspirillum denitrificans TaxID=1968433 RepID=A0A254TDJ1_9BURK|nr:hypothetical protein AYR66_15745 [Noviherbaspirillum denitrificans]